MLTKKDYVSIARILNNNIYNSDGEFRGDLLEDLINFFKSDNPNFNETIFREAVFKK